MPTYNDTSVNQLVINKLTKTQMDSATGLSSSQLYAEDPEFTGGKLLIWLIIKKNPPFKHYLPQIA